MQRDRLAAVLLDLDDLLGGHVELLGQLLRGGLAAQVLEHLALHAGQLVDDLDHVHRDADGARLVGHRAGDRLADPPRRVGRELEALGVVELLDRTDQAEVALLDEVQEQHAAAGVALGERDHEAQVGLEQVVLGVLAVLGDPPQLALELHVHLAAGVELLLGEEAGLDPLGELDLLLGVEEGDLADLLEVVLDRVGGGAGGDDLLGRGVVLVVLADDEAGGLLDLLALLGGRGLGVVVGRLGVAVVDDRDDRASASAARSTSSAVTLDVVPSTTVAGGTSAAAWRRPSWPRRWPSSPRSSSPGRPQQPRRSGSWRRPSWRRAWSPAPVVFLAAAFLVAEAVVVRRAEVAATARCAVSVSSVTWMPCSSSERSTAFIRLGVISASTSAVRRCWLSTEPTAAPTRISSCSAGWLNSAGSALAGRSAAEGVEGT